MLMTIMRKISVLLLLLTLISSPGKSQDYWTTEIISVEKDYKIEKKLWEMNLDFLMEWNNRVYIIVSRDELQNLEKENIPFTLETQSFYPRGQKISVQSGINGDYHSYPELERDLLSLQDSYPSLARVFDIGNSLEQRNIYALKISDNVNLDEDEAEVVFLGCHHAREWISVEVPFMLGKYLVENYDTNSKIKELVDNSEIWIVPLVNPDGLEYSIHFYRYWRKNMRDNGDGTYGVDLNRNYEYMWGYDNEGSSADTSDSVYRGTSPFSEPETQAIRDLFSLKNFQAMISYHSYSQVILYPWGYTSLPPEKNDLFFEMAADMSELIQSVNGNFYGYGQGGNALYITNGSTDDWTFGTYGIPSFTIELPPVNESHGGFFNAEENIHPIFNENLPAMLYLIEWTIANFETKSDFPGERKSKFLSEDQNAQDVRRNKK